MRSALLDMVQRNQIHAFLTAAPEYLEKKKSDTEVAVQVLQGLVTLGLGGPAREFVEERREFASLPGAEELRKSLDQLPEGRVSWVSLRKQFDRNAEALCSGRLEWRERIKELPESLVGLDLFQSADGFHHLSCRNENGLRRWIPALIDNSSLASLILPPTLEDQAVMVIGVGLHSMIDRLCVSIKPKSNGISFPLYVIDELNSNFAAWLHIADHTRALRDERLMIFVGNDAFSEYEQALQRNEDLAVPTILIRNTWANELGDRVDAIDKQLTQTRKNGMFEKSDILRSRVQQRDSADWMNRLRPGSLILGITSQTTTVCQYSMRDMGEALEQLGYRFKLVMEKASHRPLTNVTFTHLIADEDPALVLFINHFRKGREESIGETPVLTWIQDPLPQVFSPATGESMGSLDFCCGYYRDQCVEEFGYPNDTFIPTPFVPISPRKFHNSSLSTTDRDRYECDAAYIGHGVETTESLILRTQQEFEGMHLDFLNAVKDRVMDIIRNSRAFTFLDAPALIRDAARDHDLPLNSENCWRLGNFYAYRLYDLHFRRETLAWVASWAERHDRRFKIYGNGWDQHPTLSRFAVGPLEHGEPLRQAYRGATIVIQAIPSGLNHQRTYEALACGSTVLGRYSPLNFGGMSMDQFRAEHGDGSKFSGSLYDYGFRGLDRVVFDNAEEFTEQAEAILQSDETIETARREMRRCVLEHFTYEAAFRHILDRIRSSVPVAVNSP